MRLGPVARSAIVLLPLLFVCAARIHAQRSAAPQGVTQEINRCLALVRATTSRRRQEHDRKLEQQTAVAAEDLQAHINPAAHRARRDRGDCASAVA